MSAVSLVCLQTAPIFAEETETVSPGHSSVLDSGGEAQDGDTVSTWNELVAWMDAHATEGGTIRLTAPIAFGGTYAAVTRNPDAQPATLDLGQYGITISGDLELYCPGLTIRGQGGESASLRVLSGGDVGLSYIKAEPGADGSVIWQDEGGVLAFCGRPVTFTDVLAQNYKGTRMIDASFTCPASALTVEAEYSFDEELWITAEQAEIDLGDEAEAKLWFYEPGVAEEGDLIWDTALNPTLYLRICWLDAANEADAYSDELAFNGETMEISSDTGGNRGGGTDLDPPVTLPPPIGGDGIGGGDDSTPETPDPSPETPSGGGSTSDRESGSSGDTPPLLHPDTVPGEPPPVETPPVETPPLPSVSSTASIPVTVAGKADTVTAQTESDSDEASRPVQRKQTRTSPPATEQSEPAQEALAAVIPEPPPASNRAVGQVAAGTAATGGVIALTMTYSRWGGRFAAFLRRLIGKH